ncbi:MAG TPA: RcnB family protein, partial [Steroidobacteraceae bacterium]|nr:RcnB family protein [Steroidobacteraceae bacterium]
GRNDHRNDQRFGNRDDHRFDGRNDRRDDRRFDNRNNNGNDRWRDAQRQRDWNNRNDHNFRPDARGFRHEQPRFNRGPEYGFRHDDGRRNDWRRDNWRGGRINYGVYHRPWGYRDYRWNRGDRLPRAYYARPYVITDYWGCGLREPPYGYHWVRVDRDIVLAAVATGLVLDVIYNQFY